jgi:hypothetical protein
VSKPAFSTNQIHACACIASAVHMMDNASALPTCAPQQQQRKLLLIKSIRNYPLDCAMRLYFAQLGDDPVGVVAAGRPDRF